MLLECAPPPPIRTAGPGDHATPARATSSASLPAPTDPHGGEEGATEVDTVSCRGIGSMVRARRLTNMVGDDPENMASYETLACAGGKPT